MTELSPATVVRRSDDQVSTELDREVVALHTGRNAFFTMNEVASRVWQLLAEPIAIAAIVRTLVEEFDVEPDVCADEVTVLVDDLVDKDLVVVIAGA